MAGLALAAAMLAAGAAGLPPPAAAASAPEYPKLFGTTEVRSANLAAFPKWTGLLERYFGELDVPAGDCEDANFNQCHLKYWGRFLDNLRDVDPMVQLGRIHSYMNEAPYITDPHNWNMPDYWATPKQFFDRDGDCEDYAIAKFTSLRALGWDNDHMRIVVLKDLNLGIAHAVLVVYFEGVAWVLDNQIEQLITADNIHHYRPLFSLNEESWWLHRR